jgi:hypothetical protein
MWWVSGDFEKSKKSRWISRKVQGVGREFKAVRAEMTLEMWVWMRLNRQEGIARRKFKIRCWEFYI